MNDEVVDYGWSEGWMDLLKLNVITWILAFSTTGQILWQCSQHEFIICILHNAVLLYCMHERQNWSLSKETHIVGHWLFMYRSLWFHVTDLNGTWNSHVRYLFQIYLFNGLCNCPPSRMVLDGMVNVMIIWEGWGRKQLWPILSGEADKTTAYCC
jgi:hypothetical protein